MGDNGGQNKEAARNARRNQSNCNCGGDLCWKICDSDGLFEALRVVTYRRILALLRNNGGQNQEATRSARRNQSNCNCEAPQEPHAPQEQWRPKERNSAQRATQPKQLQLRGGGLCWKICDSDGLFEALRVVTHRRILTRLRNNAVRRARNSCGHPWRPKQTMSAQRATKTTTFVGQMCGVARGHVLFAKKP